MTKTQLAALRRVARYTCTDDHKERDDYLDNCLENRRDPHSIHSSQHVYALGLIGLGIAFKCDDKKCPKCYK